MLTYSFPFSTINIMSSINNKTHRDNIKFLIQYVHNLLPTIQGTSRRISTTQAFLNTNFPEGTKYLKEYYHSLLVVDIEVSNDNLSSQYIEIDNSIYVYDTDKKIWLSPS